MITKDTFVKILNKIERIEDYYNELSALNKKYDDLLTDIYMPTISTGFAVDYLIQSCGFDICEDDINYFIYESDFGKNFKIGNVILNNLPDGHKYREPDLSTAEKLYDFLVWINSSQKD